MPLYDYQCPSCNNTVEILITKKDDEKYWCPYCERVLVRTLPLPAKTPDKWKV